MSPRASKRVPFLALGLALLAAACEPNDPGAPLGPSGVLAEIDGGPKSLQAVTLTVHDSETDAPDANEAVLFFHADGSFAAEVQTDAAGKASYELEPGGSVVYMLHSDADALPFAPVLFTDVQPGEQLTYRTRTPVQTTTTSLTWPAFPSATQYRIAASCGDYGDFTISLSESTSLALPSCTDADVLVTATDGANFLGVLPGTGLDTSAPVALTGTPIAASAYQLTATGIHPDAENVSIEVWNALGRAVVPTGFGARAVPSANRVQVTGLVPAVPNSEVRLLVRQERAGYLDAQSELYRPHAADTAIDVAALTLPWLANPVFDFANHKIAWTQIGGAALDGVIAAPLVRRDGATFNWVVGANPTDAEIVLPVLPAPWTDYNPQSTDEVAGDFAFLRGAGLAERVHLEPSVVYDQVAGWGQLPKTDHAMAFSRTLLP